jgi:AhpD family alkylhydroperoxidase
MSTVEMVEYDQASPEVRVIYDEIMAVKGIGFVPNFWKTLASHPPLLEEVWRGLSRTMAAGRLDALTKELIALAVSATNGCTYCIRSHTAAAHKLGMDDAMLGELMAVVGTFNRTNRLADGYQVPVDPQLLAATEAETASAALTRVSRVLRQTRVASRKAQRSPKTRSHTPRRRP